MEGQVSIVNKPVCAVCEYNIWGRCVKHNYRQIMTPTLDTCKDFAHVKDSEQTIKEAARIIVQMKNEVKDPYQRAALGVALWCIMERLGKSND